MQLMNREIPDSDILRSTLQAHTDYGFAMIKPDGLELGIEHDATIRIEKAGLQIFDQRLHDLEARHVDAIYAEHTDKPFYRDLRESLIGKTALSLIVLGDSVADTLMNIKGSALDISGSIRADYSLAHSLPEPLHSAYQNGTLTSTQLFQAGFGDVMAFNRIHCDEDLIGAERSIQAVFSK